MMSWMDSTLGTVFYSVTLFGVGALVGKQMWCWLCKKMPWSTCSK